MQLRPVPGYAMTTQAIYNRWRGQSFGDILGQEHITRTLRNQIRAGRIGHAYLFAGLRGTGKTSMARILAKAVNCIGQTDDPPCNQCPPCLHITEGRSLDLIEIDAASNRGIDEIRDLRDRVAFVPQESRYKVYVIDEAHMLTREAFNALLKTLEEPPSHVIFVMCTTSPGDLPETILSRCQRYDFMRGSARDITAKLRRIADSEGFDISPEALSSIARRSGGSYRDAESLLDQVAAYSDGGITPALIAAVLGGPSTESVMRVLRSIEAGDAGDGVRAVNEAMDGGADPRQFLDDIVDMLRSLLLLRVAGDEQVRHLEPAVVEELRAINHGERLPTRQLLRAIRLFADAGGGLRHAVRPQLPIELALVESVLPVGERLAESAPAPIGEAPAPARAVVEQVAPAAPPLGDRSADAAPVSRPMSAVSGPGDTDLPAASALTASNIERVRQSWGLVVARMSARDRQVQALLRDARPIAIEGDLITLECRWPLHREQLSREERRALVEQVLGEVLGHPCRVDYTLQAQPTAAAPLPPQPQPRSTEGTSPAGEMEPRASDDEIRRALLNHPVIRDLERKGGKVSRVEVFGAESPKEKDGE